MMLTLTRGPSLTEQAAQSIRGRIVSGALACGEPLSEIALAQELGVSKTPVREALIQLKRQGLVDIHPQRGTFVFEVSAPEVRELAEMRAILEGAALRLAMERDGDALCNAWEPIVAAMQVASAALNSSGYRVLDGAFHQAVVDVAGNRFLSDAFSGIAFRLQALRSRLSQDPANDPADGTALGAASHDEHVQLLDMVRNKRSKKASDLLLLHIEGTRDRYIQVLGSTAGETAGSLSSPAGLSSRPGQPARTGRNGPTASAG